MTSFGSKNLTSLKVKSMSTNEFLWYVTQQEQPWKRLKNIPVQYLLVKDLWCLIITFTIGVRGTFYSPHPLVFIVLRRWLISYRCLYRRRIITRSSPLSSGCRTARNTRGARRTGCTGHNVRHTTITSVWMLHYPHDLGRRKSEVLLCFLITSFVIVVV